METIHLLPSVNLQIRQITERDTQGRVKKYIFGRRKREGGGGAM